MKLWKLLVLLALEVLVAAVVIGCNTAINAPDPRYYHDDKHHVSCWLASQAVYCLPDAQVNLK